LANSADGLKYGAIVFYAAVGSTPCAIEKEIKQPSRTAGRNQGEE